MLFKNARHNAGSTALSGNATHSLEQSFNTMDDDGSSSSSSSVLIRSRRRVASTRRISNKRRRVTVPSEKSNDSNDADNSGDNEPSQQKDINTDAPDNHRTQSLSTFPRQTLQLAQHPTSFARMYNVDQWRAFIDSKVGHYNQNFTLEFKRSNKVFCDLAQAHHVARQGDMKALCQYIAKYAPKLAVILRKYRDTQVESANGYRALLKSHSRDCDTGLEESAFYDGVRRMEKRIKRLAKDIEELEAASAYIESLTEAAGEDRGMDLDDDESVDRTRRSDNKGEMECD